MKVMRKLLLMILMIMLLTGCSISSSEGGSLNSSLNEPISLNITQAELIADVTDNIKYLNQDLLQTVNEFDDDDVINVIVTLDKNGLADAFNENNRGYLTIAEYADSRAATSRIEDMTAKQNELANDLLDDKLINKVNHSYTTLFNGFSATTTYGQFKKLAKSNYDIELTIAEVYSEPEVEVQESSSDAIVNEVDVYETGIFNSSGIGYDGNNTAVAILDSGFDIRHTVFQNMPDQPMISMSDVQANLYDTKAYGYYQDIKVQDVYVNEKIPFAYDYADKDSDVAPYESNHGTHVAGIIGGQDDVITGVAVNTQLVLMKVFGDVNNGAIQDDILAALEDSILLGVDAINLSLGSACGFSRSADNEYINVVYDKIQAAGISLVVAASNDYSSGYGGENSNTNKASNPDSATVGSPATYESTIAVASISGVKSRYVIDESGYTFFFNNANNNAGEAYDFYDMLYEKLNITDDTFELEYVTVPGVGKKVNYSNIDVKGKIALVKRGDTSFEEKAQVALSAGAIGCIIYNNIAGEVYMNAGSHLEIPLCSISKDDGEYLAAKGSGTIEFSKNYLAGPFMSDFSSWGPVSDLSLKPEITAHGGTILSSVPGGGYEEISGTSMACPNLCGVIILVKQALKERYPGLTQAEYTNLTNSLLMSTSTIVLNEEGNPYSPRKQGSGLGNLAYALDTMAYLSVDGQTKPKLELLDDKEETGVYELVFKVHNISDQAVKYRLKNLTMTESLSTSDPEYVAEKAYMLNPYTTASITGDGTLDEDIITVNPNGEVEITYTLTLRESEIEYIRRSFVNGMYVEGFAVLESLNEDNIDLSIPFLAFYGDWTKAPMFDKTYYEVESEAHNGAIDEEDKLKADYYATTPLGTYYYSYIIPLGSYVYELDETKYDPIPATEEKAAIGYNLETINGITSIYAGLLRNAKTMTTVITNTETGEVVYEHINYDQVKAYFSGSVVPSYDLINITAAELGLENNTKYTFSMYAELDYGDGGAANNLRNTFEFSFYVDYQAPILTDAEFYTKYDKTLKDYRYYIDAYVYDNHYAQSIRPFTIVDGKLVSLCDNVIPIYGEKGQINKVTIEITDYMDLLQYGVLEDDTFTITNGLGLLVDDYALNQSYSFVTLPGTNSSNISYKEEYYSSVSGNTYQYYQRINKGDQLDLASMLTSDDPLLTEDVENPAEYFRKLYWESSDESVVKVKNGYIEAVGKGTAFIKCSTMKTDGYMYSVKLKLEVKDKELEQTEQKLTDIEFTYFDTLKAFIDGPDMSEIGDTGDRTFFTEKSYISCYPSEQVQLGFELEPWNLTNYKLIWESTNEKVATVDEDGIVTALKEGSATITLKVEIDGKEQSLMASARVVVKNEFIIEGTTLVAYKGLGGDVVIPDDEGILYIGSYAFSLYTMDYSIEVTEDDTDAGKTPSSNDTIESIVIPADVKEVQKHAFYNCTALEKVVFMVADDGTSCSMIKQYAFAGCESLKDINLNEIDLIGECAFLDCTSLKTVDITKAYALGRRAFAGCTSLEYIDITSVINTGAEVFLDCTNLKTIDNGIFSNFSSGMFKNSGLTTLTYYADRIANNCFENCTSLKDVTIVNPIVYVGNKAFSNCTSLEEVKFNDSASAEFIYENAFLDCTSLKTIYLPDGEFLIERNAFNNCSSLEELVFNTNTKIKENLGIIFTSCSSLTTFTVKNDNLYYSANNNLLLTKDQKEIILAAVNYNYNNYIIPNGIKVINTGAFSSITELTSLNLNEVEIVKNNAFENCTSLTEVHLPTEGITLGEYVFAGCENLETINLNVLTKVPAYAFANTALKEVVLENVEIETGAFSNISTLEKVVIKTNNLAPYAFSDNEALTYAVIDTKCIGDYAFKNNHNLTNLSLSNVVTIGEGAFIGCSLLTNINNNTIETVEAYAFMDTPNLESINLENVKYIGDYAFAGSSVKNSNKLTTLVFGDLLEEIGQHAFEYNTNLLSVTIGSGINKIGAYAFGNNTSLVNITTLGNIETIEEGTFVENSSLENVNINGIKYINTAAFLSCVSLSTIDLSSALTIGMQAFENCIKLTSVDLNSVLVLEAGAFLSATNLVSINMPIVERIEEQALSCIGVTEIVLPETLQYVAPTAFYYNQKFTKFVDKNGNDTADVNDYVKLDKGVLYLVTENNKLLLSSYPTAKEHGTYTVLNNTVRIEEYAAYFNKNLRSLTFPDTLSLIGNMAFYGCTNIKTIEFKSVKAPVLEGTVSVLDLEYDTSSEVYQLLNKYFQFNGYYPLYYGQFKDMIGKTTKMNIVVPENAEMSGYEDILYDLYFDLDKLTKSSYVALNTKSIDYLNKVTIVPTNVTLQDKNVIIEAKTAYNLLDQDLTKYCDVHGFTEDELANLYNNLIKAEEEWNKLNNARISKVYSYLLQDIANLGSTYQFEKISEYYSIVEKLEIVNRDDLEYIDKTNVDEFKKGFDEYFKNLNDDVNTITNITSLPTTTVNKVGLVIGISTAISLGGILFAIIRKRLF